MSHNLGRNRRSVPSEESMHRAFDAIYAETGYRPTLAAMRQRGYDGTEDWFYICQRQWKRTHGSPTRNQNFFVPDDLEASCRAVREERGNDTLRGAR